MISFTDFRRRGLSYAAKSNFHGEVYFMKNIARLFNTFKFVASLMKEQRDLRLLSIGAGGAFVEICLAEFYDYKVTVLDFDDVIKANKEYYSELGFTTIPANVTQCSDRISGEYDIVLSMENIEHIPEPPSKYISRFVGSLVSGGYFIITTPNLGRAATLYKIGMMKPIMPPPEKFFAPVTFGNEGIHRREYMVSEISKAMTMNDLKPCKVSYTFAARENSIVGFIRQILEIIAGCIPRFRPIMIIAGKK